MRFETRIGRRQVLAGGAAGVVSYSAAGWLQRLAAEQGDAKPRRSCLLLWMAGGPSQNDTFDLKPGHANGGPFQAIETSVSGIRVSQHLPEVAKWMHKLAVIRSMSTREGDHGRATDNLRTGYFPMGPIQFPPLGSLVSKESGPSESALPNYVSILGRGLFRSGRPAAGFLGPDYAPLLVGNDSGNEEARLRVENLALADGVSEEQSRMRRDLLASLESEFLSQHPGAAADSHRSAYARSARLMSAEATEAFDLEKEPAAIQERYGRSQFGQGCLLARRLIERRVPFVEVTLGGWDTHYDNFEAVQRLSATLDKGWGSLMQDLDERGLLESTVVVWMGEFGRTPVINPQQGRDHYPKAWSVVLGGGGIRGGQVVGRTGEDGLTVEDRPVTTPDLMATIVTALGLDPRKQNISNVARPIRLVDPEGKAVSEVLES